MRCNTTIKLYKPVIKRLSNAAITALEKTAEELHTQVIQAQVMPFKTGNLQNESSWVDYSESKSGKVSINHSTPYARRLYYHPEYNFNQKDNPNAQGRWWEDWIIGSKRGNAQKAFATFYKKEAGL